MTRIREIEARLPVSDLTAARGFYEGLLGFECVGLWPDEAPEFAILRHGDRRLQLSTTTEAPSGRTREVTLWIDVDTVRELHHGLASEVDIEWGPEDYDYGRREFAVRDPDGHLVVLSESLDPTLDRLG